MFEHLFASMVGGLVASLSVAVGGVALMLRAFYNRSVYTDDSGWVGALHAYVTSFPHYMYHATDWQQYVRGVTHGYWVGFVVTWLGTLLYVGFTHVYL